jgi:hypothetical protein
MPSSGSVSAAKNTHQQTIKASTTKMTTTVVTNPTEPNSSHTKPRAGSLIYHDPKTSLLVMADLIKALTAALQDRDEQIAILKSNRNHESTVQHISNNDNYESDYDGDKVKNVLPNCGENEQQLEQIRYERDIARVNASELAVRLAECQARLDLYMDQEKLYHEISLNKTMGTTTMGKSPSTTTEISTVRFFWWMFGNSKNDSRNDDRALPNLQEDWSSSSSLSRHSPRRVNDKWNTM